MKTQRFCVVLSTFVLVCLATAAIAQQGYKKPPKEVLDILNAPTTPGASVSPTNLICLNHKTGTMRMILALVPARCGVPIERVLARCPPRLALRLDSH